jgi:uncharacterized protein YlxW (UPF0749 family)
MVCTLNFKGNKMGQLVNEIESVINAKKEKKTLATERQKILDQMAKDEAAKSNLVKKALAKQRAIYGAAGMTGKGMTEEAVLKRLREETEEPFDEKKSASLEKISKLRPTKKKNLLKSALLSVEKIVG